MSSEDTDVELEQLVRRLIPVAKARVLHSSKRSPETFAEELGTLANLYVIRANVAEG